MSNNPSQGKQSDTANNYGSYGGYSGGYQPSNPADDPYGAHTSTSNNTQQNDPNYSYGQQQSYNYGSQQNQQQQQAYQAPESVTRRQRQRSSFNYGSAATSANANTGFIDQTDRCFALFSYLGLCFTGIFFLLFKSRQRPFVRFHAAQSIVVFVPIMAVLALLKLIVGLVSGIFLLGWLIAFVIGLINIAIIVPAIVLWLLLMFMAYRGVRFKLPFVGDYAEALERRFK